LSSVINKIQDNLGAKMSLAQAGQGDKRGYNLHMKKICRRMALLLFFFFLIIGCTVDPALLPQETLSIKPPENPYQAKTNTPLESTPTSTTPPEQPLVPTSTPFLHIVKSGDTLSGIALQYNITIDNLVSANPGVNTSMLTVGTELIIPLSGDESSFPSPTPYPLQVDEAICYPARSGGSWCYATVINDQDLVFENITGAFNLIDQQGVLFQSYPAITPLDYLFPDQRIPLTVFIDQEIPNTTTVSAVLLSALPATEEENQTQITNLQINFRADEKIAAISGFVEKVSSDLQGDQFWVVAIGYHQGIPVGTRKWISLNDGEIEEGFNFEFFLYSLDQQIDDVEVFSEIH
jgi:LysM repeat protein